MARACAGFIGVRSSVIREESKMKSCIHPNLLFIFLAVMVLSIGMHTSVFGQSAANTGQIVGQVLDPSGASVAGAEVTVRNKDTNFSRNATTDTAGRFAAPYLPLGRYEVTVRATGLQAPAQEAFVTQGS